MHDSKKHTCHYMGELQYYIKIATQLGKLAPTGNHKKAKDDANFGKKNNVSAASLHHQDWNLESAIEMQSWTRLGQWLNNQQKHDKNKDNDKVRRLKASGVKLNYTISLRS